MPDKPKGSKTLPPADLAVREAMKEEFGIVADGLIWLGVHGTLCLGLRHPAYTGASREIVLNFVRQLGKALVAKGVLTAEELALVERVEQQESPHGSG